MRCERTGARTASEWLQLTTALCMHGRPGLSTSQQKKYNTAIIYDSPVEKHTTFIAHKHQSIAIAAIRSLLERVIVR